MPSSTATAETAAQPETRPAPQPLTADQRKRHDDLCDKFLADKGRAEQIADALKRSKQAVLTFTDTHGVIPAEAEKSRRVAGNLYESTATTPNTITVSQAGVAKLEDALLRKEIDGLFPVLFARTVVYEAQRGAADKLNEFLASSDIGAAERTRILALYAQCFDIGDRAPTVKVESLASIAQREKEAAAKAAKKSSKKARA